MRSEEEVKERIRMLYSEAEVRYRMEGQRSAHLWSVLAEIEQWEWMLGFGSLSIIMESYCEQAGVAYDPRWRELAGQKMDVVSERIERERHGIPQPEWLQALWRTE